MLFESAAGEENGRRNYFMINLHESMGPGSSRNVSYETVKLFFSFSCVANQIFIFIIIRGLLN